MSRPSRTAAGAARKAIRANFSLEASAEDSGFAEADDSHDLDNSGTFGNLKPSRKCKKTFTEPDAPEVVVHDASVQCLPAEIRSMIIKYLDDEKDYWSIYNLMQVSRSWWNHLAKTGSAEEDWLRRIRDGMKRSTKLGRKCLNYRQTFALCLKSRCAGCWKPSSNSFSHVWPEGPQWLKVCNKCRHREAFYLRVIKTETDRKKLGLLQSELRNLANPEADPSNSGAAALVVDVFLAEKREKALVNLEKLLAGYRGHRDQEMIRRAFQENAFVQRTLSWKLRAAVNDVARKGCCDDRDLGRIARTQGRLEKLVDGLRKKLRIRGYDERLGDSLLRSRDGRSSTTTAMDHFLGWYRMEEALDRLVAIVEESVTGNDKSRRPSGYGYYRRYRTWNWSASDLDL